MFSSNEIFFHISLYILLTLLPIFCASERNSDFILFTICSCSKFVPFGLSFWVHITSVLFKRLCKPLILFSIISI
uniref:Uncharacterized protein n=1 Tax=Panstrongylus lignarius TaxID=156445 RepID=A0A224Y0D6_9HEMI